jgi:hypothetical protein
VEKSDGSEMDRQDEVKKINRNVEKEEHRIES